MISSTLKADTLHMKLFREFDFDPGSIVVFSFPLVPDLLTWAEKILRLSVRALQKHMMFGSDSGGLM